MIPVNFVARSATASELDDLRSATLQDVHWSQFDDSRGCWVKLPYLYLKNLTHQPTCQINNEALEGHINFVLNHELPRINLRRHPFIVGVRADYPARSWVNAQLVQNKFQVGRRAFWMPLFPQQGLIPRSKERGTVFRRVGYFGRMVNHYTRLTRRRAGLVSIKQALETLCEQQGLELVERGPGLWNNYSDVDVVIGIRDFSGREFPTKPPSKLVNAWLAGVPFIGGTDSAFLDVGKPGRDFLRVESLEALRSALKRLSSDIDLRMQLVENGHAAAVNLRSDNVAQSWLRLVSGPVADLFRRHSA